MKYVYRAINYAVSFMSYLGFLNNFSDPQKLNPEYGSGAAYLFTCSQFPVMEKWKIVFDKP